MDGMTNNQAVEQPKKGNGALIAVIIAVVLVLAAGGFAFYWFNRPIYKVTKAIEASDYASAVKYYGKLKSDEKEDVAEQFLDYCEEVKSEYYDDDLEYDEAADELDLFEDALEDERDYEDIVNSVSLLKASRDAWAKAEDLFDSKDYETAVDMYADVIKDDKNYEKAQKRIEECNRNIIVGTWVAEVDLSDAITEQMGQDGLHVDFVLKLVYTFNEDGTATIATDDESIKEQMGVMFDNIIDVVINQYCESYGVSAEDMDALFISTYGLTFAEYVKSNMDMDSLVPDNISQRKDCTYVVNGKNIEMIDEDGISSSNTLTYVGGGVIEIDSADGIESLAQYGVELPLILNKQ